VKKIYTKTGDVGETGLFAGGRVAKDHPRVEAYGAVDELAAWIGMVLAADPLREIAATLKRVAEELAILTAELATPKREALGDSILHDEQVQRLEDSIDQFQNQLPPLTEFILPGGTKIAAMLHLARTVCRRAERRVVTLAHQPEESVPSIVLIYLNRLSDLLFVLSRVANQTDKDRA